ncbi:MAG: hypothetical protein U0R67_08500 [Micropruina glycogenica]
MPTQQNRRHLDRRGVGAMTLPLAQFVQRAELEAEPRSGAGHPPADVFAPTRRRRVAPASQKILTLISVQVVDRRAVRSMK